MDWFVPYSLPIAPLIFLGLLALLVFLFFILPIKLAGKAFEKSGVPRRYVFLVLMACLLGSGINIPVASIGGHSAPHPETIGYHSRGHGAPRIEGSGRTIIAVNVGGAVIPILVCGYLIVKRGWSTRLVLAVVLVSAVIHHLATPVRGVGIAIPMLIPPISAAVAAYLLARKDAPRTAYIAGTLGTLIGADLLNLGHIGSLGAPVASIGGAGTFDGIFITGLVAALLV